MNPTTELDRLGQRLWLDNITRDLLVSGTLVLYIEALVAPDTINTVPDKTLLAYADHGRLRGEMPADGGNAEATLAEFARAGIDDAAVAEQLLREGIRAFDKSWGDLMECIAAKVRELGQSPVARSSRR
jgi:transaldolase